ncbi:MAG: hypothetical protein ABIE94_02750 [archaeon]
MPLSIIEKFADKLAEIKNIIGVKVDKKKGNLIVTGEHAKVTIPILVINKNADATHYFNKLFPYQKIEYEAGKHFVRSDLIKNIGETQLIESKYEKIIKELDKHLPKTDIAAIRYAATMCRLEDTGMTEKEKENMMSQLGGFFKSKRGSTLYNWLRCDEVFEEEIIPQLKFCKSVSSGKEKTFHKLFDPYWESMLQFHPNKIFVSRTMDNKELAGEIYLRLIIHEREEIFVYTRRSRNEFAYEVIKDFLGEFSDYISPKPKKYKIGSHPARKFTVKRKS